MHPLGFDIKRGINGWPLFSHQVREAWWILTGKWSLHRAWQKGYDDHASAEFGRQIATGQIKLYGTAPAERTMAEGCCSAIFPCSHQQRDPYSICEICQKASAFSSQEQKTP